MRVGSLEFKPVQENPMLVSDSVLKALSSDFGVLVAEIDPQYMNGLSLSEHYGLNPDDGANCIIVRGERDGVKVMAAVVAPVGHRSDLNGVVCQKLYVKKVSMAPLEEILKETGMEYGSITPIGLPGTYKILIDNRLMQKEWIIVGGGKQISKLLVSTDVFRKLPNVEVVEGLATQHSGSRLSQKASS